MNTYYTDLCFSNSKIKYTIICDIDTDNISNIPFSSDMYDNIDFKNLMKTYNNYKNHQKIIDIINNLECDDPDFSFINPNQFCILRSSMLNDTINIVVLKYLVNYWTHLILIDDVSHPQIKIDSYIINTYFEKNKNKGYEATITVVKNI